MYSFQNKICEKQEEEVWKICSYPTVIKDAYFISSYGQIKNAITGRILKQYELVRDSKTENVYYIIKLKFYDHLKREIRYKNFRVSRLVAWEFCEKPEGCNIVEHVNDNKLDNYFRNLKWSTSGVNTRNAIKTCRLNINGESNTNNKYSEMLIHFLCSLMEEGKSNKEILLIWCGKDATIRKNAKEWSLINHLRSKDRFTDIAIQYDYDALFHISENDKKILSYIDEKKENIDIMKIFGYNTPNDNTALYSEILKCRKIYNIRSTTRERH